MVRVIAGVIVGYIVSVALTVAGIFGAWAAFGVEGAFAENSTVASTQWSITICVLGFVAAIVAGATAAAIGRHPKRLAVKLLAAVMLLLGLGAAVINMGIEPQPRPADWAGRDVGFTEAGEVASSPTWYNFVIPFIGAAGVVVGGTLVRKPE